MSAIVFKRTKVEIDLYGDKVSFERPSVGRLERFFEETKSATELEARGLWVSFLEELGFKKDQLDGMEPEHFGKLIEAVTGTSTKKSQTGG